MALQEFKKLVYSKGINKKKGHIIEWEKISTKSIYD